MAASVTEIGTSSVSANPASTISVTTTAIVNVGEILFFYFDLISATGTTATATATAGGHAMTQDASFTRGNASTVGFLFRYEPASSLASGSTVTATVTNAGAGSAAKCIKVSGLATGVGLDTTIGTNNGLSQTPSTANSGTPATTDEIFALAILAVTGVGTAGQASVSTAGYTALTEVVQSTRSDSLVSAWKDIPATVAAQNVSWTTTWGANKAWAAGIALYKVASSGVTNNQSLTATVNLTASFQNQINKNLTASNVALTALIQKQTNKGMIASNVSVTPSIKKQVNKALSATVTLSQSITRQVNKNLSTTVTINPSITKLVLKNLQATVVLSATLVALKVILMVLTATVNVTASIQKQVAKLLSASVALAGSIRKTITKTLSTTINITASLVATFKAAGSVAAKKIHTAIIIGRF